MCGLIITKLSILKVIIYMEREFNKIINVNDILIHIISEYLNEAFMGGMKAYLH